MSSLKLKHTAHLSAYEKPTLKRLSPLTRVQAHGEKVWNHFFGLVQSCMKIPHGTNHSSSKSAMWWSVSWFEDQKLFTFLHMHSARPKVNSGERVWWAINIGVFDVCCSWVWATCYSSKHSPTRSCHSKWTLFPHDQHKCCCKSIRWNFLIDYLSIGQ